jgi:hypothetical protein
MIEYLGNLSREGFTKSSMTDYFQQQQIASKFSLASIILSDAMIAALKRELRRIAPNVRVDEGFLKTILENEVLKREVVGGDEACQAADFLKRCTRAALRAKEKKNSNPNLHYLFQTRIHPIKSIMGLQIKLKYRGSGAAGQ